jgi:hypothetical protein
VILLFKTTLELHPSPSNAHHGKQQQQIAAFQLGQTRYLGRLGRWISGKMMKRGTAFTMVKKVFRFYQKND